MGMTMIWARWDRIHQLIRYAIDPKKTEECRYVSTRGCTKENMFNECAETKALFQQEEGVQMYHMVQSFYPGTVDKRTAHLIGREFARTCLNGYESLVATHLDHDHIHNHIIFNSVNYRTGAKYLPREMPRFRSVEQETVRLCRQYGVPVERGHTSPYRTYTEQMLHREGNLTAKEVLDKTLREVISISLDRNDFTDLMEARGYEVTYALDGIRFREAGEKQGFRAKLDGKLLTEQKLDEQIEAGLLDPAFQIIRPKEWVPYEPKERESGFRALYGAWIHILGLIGKGYPSPYPEVGYSQFRHFQMYKRQHDFLVKHGFSKVDEVMSYRDSLRIRYAELSGKRKKLQSKKCAKKEAFHALAVYERYSGIPGYPAEEWSGREAEWKEYQEAVQYLEGKDITALRDLRDTLSGEIAAISEETGKLRCELHICGNILRDSPRIETWIGGGPDLERPERKQEREVFDERAEQ